jgi:hypothetical protein
MTFIALLVGIALMLVTHGTAHTVGEILVIVGGALVSLQLAIFCIAARIAIKTGRSYTQRFF